jgi:hypothetical protein
MKTRHLSIAVVLAAAAAVPAALVTSCSAEESSECMTTTRFFAERVWGPTISKKCINCHTPYGLAKSSAFILQDESNPGYISYNLGIVAKIAELEKDGESLLLRKAAGQLSHGGGAQVQEGSDEYAALEELVARLYDGESDACAGSSTTESVAAYATLLEWAPALRKASMNLVSRWPTEEEEEAVREGGEPAFDAVLLAMMKEDAFYERLKEIWNDYLLTDKFLPMPGSGGMRGVDILPTGDAQNGAAFDDFPNVHKIAARFPDEREQMFAGVGVAREPLELIAHVVRNGRPFTEILTADYTMVNPYSAFVFGVDEEVGFANSKDPTEYREARLKIQRNGVDIPIAHAGLLTSHALLSRFPTSVTSRNRSRANAILNLFLGINARRLAERSIDPTRVTGHNPTMNHPDCTVCHTVLDPVAGAFKQWPWVHPGNEVRYMPAEGGPVPINAGLGGWPAPGAWFTDMLAPGLGSDIVPSEEWGSSERWLAQKLAADRRFALNVVQKMFAGLTGHTPLQFPSDANATAEINAWDVQSAYLKTVTDEFVSSKYDLRRVILAIMKSPYYRAAGFSGKETADRNAELRDVGTGRILTAEMLDRKIKAVTGLWWAPEQKGGTSQGRGLLAGVMDLGKETARWGSVAYGGHEGGSLPERFTTVNPVMANMSWKMANEMGCFATAWDFMHPAGERRLFPLVELSDTPEDAAGSAHSEAVLAIKKNMVHLHRRVWGVDLAEDSDEVQQAYSLFYDTWRGGLDALADGTEKAWAPCRIQTQPDAPPGTPLEPGLVTIDEDKQYTMRSWSAVLTYLLADYSFLYE